jgi:hypothetical protein
LLVAAERQRGIAEIMGVDPHRAGLDAAHEFVSDAEIARPDARSEAVAGVVVAGARDSVDIVVVERDRADDRTKISSRTTDISGFVSVNTVGCTKYP